MNFQNFVDQAAREAAFTARPADCTCSRTEVRMRAIRGGSRQYVRQCLDCGESVGNPVRQEGDAVAFDESLRDCARVSRQSAIEAAKKSESEFWWREYHRYMKSDAWFSLRGKVLARDGGICQGCLTAGAVEVHHKTYDHFGSEFAFELMSLCKLCHERMHA